MRDQLREVSVKGRTLLRTAVAVAIVLLLLLVVRVPVPFDVSDVSKVQLNGGTLRLVTSEESRLIAKAPIVFAPFLMVRRTGEMLEIGGFDEADSRVLLVGLFPLTDVPVPAYNLSWELRTDRVEEVTVAGGTLVADRYESDALAVFAVSGKADLRAVDIGTLALFAQPGGEITASGSTERLSVMDSDGQIDYETLRYGYLDPDIIRDIIEQQ